MTPNELNNLPVLGSAVDLVTAIACEIVGNEVAGELEGEKLTQNAIRVLASSTLNNVLTEKTRYA
jgi:hypothetical protein